MGFGFLVASQGSESFWNLDDGELQGFDSKELELSPGQI